jgi:hypothetical protein
VPEVAVTDIINELTLGFENRRFDYDVDIPCLKGTLYSFCAKALTRKDSKNYCPNNLMEFFSFKQASEPYLRACYSWLFETKSPWSVQPYVEEFQDVDTWHGPLGTPVCGFCVSIRPSTEIRVEYHNAEEDDEVVDEVTEQINASSNG